MENEPATSPSPPDGKLKCSICHISIDHNDPKLRINGNALICNSGRCILSAIEQLSKRIRNLREAYAKYRNVTDDRPTIGVDTL